MRLRWTAPAAQDLYTIARYIAKDNPATARKVAKTIYDACAGLQQFPYRGKKGRVKGTRELVFPGLPYVGVYRIREGVVELARIYHAAQER